jgi:glucose-fructose oxidoreductase
MNDQRKTVDLSSVTRRGFIKGAIFGSAMLASNLTCSSQSPYEPRGQRKLGIALLGLGRYATGQLGPSLRETRNCELTAVITGTPAKGEKWMADYGLKRSNVYSYETMDAIAGNKEIDIVYVVTPPALHPQYSIRAAKLGKHVISEKPMATTVEDCDRMIAAARDAKVQLGIGYRLHYEPHHLEMERATRAKELGEIQKMSGGFGYVMRQRESRITRSLSGGGPLMDVGIYVLHAACMVIGKPPTYVTAKEELKLNPELFNEVEEGISWTMEFPGGEKCDGFASFNKGANQFRVEGKKGWIQISPSFSYGGIGGETDRGRMNLPAVNQQALQMDDFAACVLSGKKTGVPGELGRRDIQIMMAIYEAARTGKRVKVNA